ncbi:MAG: SpoIIE family protein phosphatase [Phycisphaeraceae bacterium]
MNAQPAADETGAKHAAETGPAPTPTAVPLSLTDFLDVPTLQDIQDRFTAVTRLATTIRDAQGRQVTAPTAVLDVAQSDVWLDQLITAEPGEGRFSAPIIAEGQVLGSISIEREAMEADASEARPRFVAAARELGIDEVHVEALADAAGASYAPSRAASIQFLYLLANAIARLCYEQYHARQRIEELSALYRVSTLLSARRDLSQVLDTAAGCVAEVMKVKAASIRLLDETANNELVPKAVHNLSQAYLDKGAIRLEDSELFHEALAGGVPYVADMATDPRVVYPEDAAVEGLVSMLCAGMIHQGKPIGVLQLFTGVERRFTGFEINLVRAMAQLLGSVIENARLNAARQENERMVRQLHLAADVQRRMLPGSMPHLPPFDIAARYVPSFEVGGDFYDFIDLDGHLGVAIGDVVGKGVAASLLMASARASLRAYAQDVYDLDEIIARVNVALCRDTSDNEFATMWYGVFDPRSRRLTYCNAGHEPGLLYRNETVRPLAAGGMLVGVDPAQVYDKGLLDLRDRDVVLLFSDGLVDAFNEENARFGRKRVEQAMREAADRSASEILQHVLQAARRWAGRRRSVDDTTVVVLKMDERVE